MFLFCVWVDRGIYFGIVLIYILFQVGDRFVPVRDWNMILLVCRFCTRPTMRYGYQLHCKLRCPECTQFLPTGSRVEVLFECVRGG